MNVILGYLKAESNHFHVNVLYLIRKKYIFQCSKTSKKPNLLGLLKHAEFVYMEQNLVAAPNFITVQCEGDWQTVKLLTQNLCVQNDAETSNRQ